MNKTLEERLVRKKPLILVADCHPDFLGLISSSVKELGYHVVEASTIDMAISAFDEYSPEGGLIGNLPGNEPAKFQSGYKLIDKLMGIDPTVAYAILTESYPSTNETSLVADRGLNIVSWRYKTELRNESLEEAIRKVIQRTKKLRVDLIHKFLDDYYERYELATRYREWDEPEFEPLKLDSRRDSGFVNWLRVMYERIPLGGGLGFMLSHSKTLGVKTFGLIYPTKDHGKYDEFFTIKMYTPEEMRALIDNSKICLEPEPFGVLKHVRPLVYTDGNPHYALRPFILGPNRAYVLRMLNQVDEYVAEIAKNHPDWGINLVREMVNEFIPEVERAVSFVDRDVMRLWHSKFKQPDKIGEQDIERIKAEYLQNTRISLQALAERSLDERLRELMDVGMVDLSRNPTSMEIDLFLSSLKACFNLAACYPEFFLKLMDNSPQNQIFNMGILSPTPKQFFDKTFKHLKLPQAFHQNRNKHRTQWLYAPLRTRYVPHDTHHRIGHVMEDVVNSIHSPEASSISTPEKKIDYVVSILEKILGKKIDDPRIWMDYAGFGLGKTIHRQNRMLVMYASSNDRRYHIKISDEDEYRANARVYAESAISWGKEAAWFFAPLVHFVVDRLLAETTSFYKIAEEVSSLVKGNGLESYRNQLLGMPQPTITVASSLPEHALNVVKFCNGYCVPYSTLLASLNAKVR